MDIYCLGLKPDFGTIDWDNFRPPTPVPYAYYSAIGTWKSDRPPCPTCRWHWTYRAEPLLVQWEPRRDNIGDFSYNGPQGEYNFVVTERVAQFFEQHHYPFELRSIEYVKPRRRGKLPCVPFPYQGRCNSGQFARSTSSCMNRPAMCD